MKPDWKDAPEWANWLVPKSDFSDWLWFENRPVWNVSKWEWEYSGRRSLASRDHTLWVEERPKGAIGKDAKGEKKA